MPWLWFAGPLTFVLLVVIFNLWPTSEERRLRRELDRWLDEFLGPLPDEEEEGEVSRIVPELPTAFERAVTSCGGGARITDIVLVPRHAYLAVRGADVLTGSNHCTVVCRLASRAPKLTVRPLPIVDGKPVENDGVEIDDPEFMDHYLVESDNPRAAKKWLDEEVCEAMVQFPDLWLRAEGQTLTLSFYGSVDAELLDELIESADIVFAAHGAGGGEPLFGDPDAVLQPVSYREHPGGEEEADEEEPEIVEVLGSKVDRITAGVIDYGLYALGGVFLVMVLGHFPGFHPSWLFNSPDLTVTEPWQGGWTTKGFGALVMVETYLLGLLTWQAHLAVKSGQSIGKKLVGLQIHTIDGERRTFGRMVLLRSWVFALVPLVAAVIQAESLSARGIFGAIPTLVTGAATLGIGIVLAVSWMASGAHRGIHDMLARTEVVECEPYRVPSVQLEISKNDPVVGRRMVWGACAVVAFVGVNLLTLTWLDAWFFEVHQWR